MNLDKVLRDMYDVYVNDPMHAVRSQKFINVLHEKLADDLRSRLTTEAQRRNVEVVLEANIYGSHKAKKVDVSVIAPQNGPLVMIGVRSQMSSVAKNALMYYEGIIGDCISLQERFPMAVIGYVYLMPLSPIKKGQGSESIDHLRYARMYDAITGRSGQLYRETKGVFDQFAYMVVDFDADPPFVCEDIIKGLSHDLSITTFVDRVASTFENRHFFVKIFD